MMCSTPGDPINIFKRNATVIAENRLTEILFHNGKHVGSSNTRRAKAKAEYPNVKEDRRREGGGL